LTKILAIGVQGTTAQIRPGAGSALLKASGTALRPFVLKKITTRKGNKTAKHLSSHNVNFVSFYASLLIGFKQLAITIISLE
jgi:hypothetical protein